MKLISNSASACDTNLGDSTGNNGTNEKIGKISLLKYTLLAKRVGFEKKSNFFTFFLCYPWAILYRSPRVPLYACSAAIVH